MRAERQIAGASQPFSLNLTGTLSRRHLAHFCSAVDSKYAELLGLLQARYGHAKEQAEREINDWASGSRDIAPPGFDTLTFIACQ
jgi:hypothetical protein